eukprot:1138870-Prorocentrum_lima.AAC.1
MERSGVEQKHGLVRLYPRLQDCCKELGVANEGGGCCPIGVAILDDDVGGLAARMVASARRR